MIADHYENTKHLFLKLHSDEKTVCSMHKDSLNAIVMFLEMKELEEDDEESDELNLDQIDESTRDINSSLPWDLEHVPYAFKRLSVEEMIKRSNEFYELMNSRRTLRFFSSDLVPVEIIHNIIRTAGYNINYSISYI